MAISGASVRSFKASVDITASIETKIDRIGPREAAGAAWWHPEKASELRALRGGPLARCFPSDDSRFAAHAQGLFDAWRTSEPRATAVEALLRETYPLAVVHRRHELAAIDGRRVWYAFRDGSLVPVGEGHTP
jgi:hypothetical protein